MDKNQFENQFTLSFVNNDCKSIYSGRQRADINLFYWRIFFYFCYFFDVKCPYLKETYVGCSKIEFNETLEEGYWFLLSTNIQNSSNSGNMQQSTNSTFAIPVSSKREDLNTNMNTSHQSNNFRLTIVGTWYLKCRFL